MEAYRDSGTMINGYPGTGTTWGHGRRLADGTVEVTADDIQHLHEQGVSRRCSALCVAPPPSIITPAQASPCPGGPRSRLTTIYHTAQFIILRQAFTPERIASLIAAVRTMVAKGVAQEESSAAESDGPNVGWIDRTAEFPTRTSNMCDLPIVPPLFKGF